MWKKFGSRILFFSIETGTEDVKYLSLDPLNHLWLIFPWKRDQSIDFVWDRLTEFYMLQILGFNRLIAY